jgi:disulfide bond formation protein DsbB
VFEDWSFHVLLPLAAYAALALSACLACPYERPALFLIVAASLLLLFIGIHNAWDIATFHLFVQKRKQRDVEPPAETEE